MAYSEWKEKIEGFKKVDVRGVAGNFLEGIKMSKKSGMDEDVLIAKITELIRVYS